MAKKLILGCGNPLLDISAEVDESLLEKYGLQHANAILAEEKHLPLYEELVEKYNVTYIAGGATQNSIRVAKWMLQDKGRAAYIGAVGQDQYSKQLEESAAKDGVETHYMHNAEVPTGTCAVCVVKKDRSLVANLGAANTFRFEHIESEACQQALNESSVAYMAGFFLTVSPQTAEYIGRHCAEHNKIFALNLAAPFIVEFFGEAVSTVIPYADYVFCNEDEAATYARVHNLEDQTPAGVGKHICALPKVNGGRPRIMVVTQGKEPTVVVIGTDVIEFPTPLLDKSLIVDTNGAGDSFVGGFLAELLLDKPLEECIKAGQYAARTVIQHNGCTFPEKPADESEW